MTLKERLKKLRCDIGISQEAMGAQGFVSKPGWAKIENGQRAPSDKLIFRLVGWLYREKHLTVSAAGRVTEEILTLKYLNSRSAFVRKLARFYAEQQFEGTATRLSDDPAVYRPKPRPKPAQTAKG